MEQSTRGGITASLEVVGGESPVFVSREVLSFLPTKVFPFNSAILERKKVQEAQRRGKYPARIWPMRKDGEAGVKPGHGETPGRGNSPKHLEDNVE